MAPTGVSHADSSKAPKVVATIPPVHSLVALVMQGVGQAELLLPGNVSPHSHSLKPSQAKQLANADIVFWVSPEIETFLKKSITTLSGKTVALVDAPSIKQRPFRDLAKLNGASEKGHDHDKEHSDGHDDHDDHHDHAGGNDPHIWLDPQNGIAILGVVAVELAKVDPENAAKYQANAAEAKAKLEQLDAKLSDQFATHKTAAYVVFHDAYGHFEGRYGLKPSGVVSINPEIAPGAATVAALRKRLSEENVRCVFQEPQFSPRTVNAVVSGSNVARAQLDPLGATVEPGPGLYVQLVAAMAEAYLNCGQENGDLSKG